MWHEVNSLRMHGRLKKARSPGDCKGRLKGNAGDSRAEERRGETVAHPFAFSRPTGPQELSLATESEAQLLEYW
jgi:hypothetical protein